MEEKITAENGKKFNRFFCRELAMKTIKVYFSNGDSLITSINGTREEIEKYYLGNSFNLGDGERDLMATAEKVEFLD